MICLQCNKEFTPKRKSARYCSVSSRVAYSRSKGSTDTGLSLEEVIEKKESVPRTSDEPAKQVVERFPGYKGDKPFELCPKHNVFRSSCKCL